MNRRLIIPIVLWCALLSQAAQAQFGISVAGVGVRHFGKVGIGEYPINNPNEVIPNGFPTLFGPKLRGTYGFPRKGGKNSVSLGVGYYFPTREVNVLYGGVTMKPRTLEMELSYHRYFIGTYDFSEFKLYGIVGVSAIQMYHNYNIPDIELVIPGERKYFDNSVVQTGHYNIGLGTELPVGGSFFFLEGRVSIHGNTYYRRTTIMASSLGYFGSVTAGMRFPINGREPGRHPRTRRR
ncbi:MAG: hypothetical protein MUC97_07875 [Bernardetiaceae bacterium]|jgi:hypothetical protein|nr:hypothetical protein [Bernardetiaceae bacterium]